MLSRVADSLFWMATYLERAEHTARLLEVNLAMMLDEGEVNSERRWQRTLRALAYVPELMWRGDAYELANRLSFDIENRSSIYACIVAARENARAVREQISTEQWQRLNQLYHAATKVETENADLQKSEFLQAVIEGIHLFQGVTDSTMSHGTGWQFIQLGRHLERAAATARLLSAYYGDLWAHENENVRLLFHSDSAMESNVYLECIGLLRSCTAYEAWFRMYTAEVTPERVLDFLLLDAHFPHSIRYSVDMVDEALKQIGGESGLILAAPLLRLSGALRSSLEFGRIEEVLTLNTAEYLKNILEKCREIHAQVYRIYIHYSVQAALTV